LRVQRYDFFTNAPNILCTNKQKHAIFFIFGEPKVINYGGILREIGLFFCTFLISRTKHRKHQGLGRH
jgi:hypothetical protein